MGPSQGSEFEMFKAFVKQRQRLHITIHSHFFFKLQIVFRDLRFMRNQSMFHRVVWYVYMHFSEKKKISLTV